MEQKYIIQVDLTDFSKSARLHIGRDWPKAVTKAFGELAEKGASSVRGLTRRRFKLHSEFIPRGIRSYPRTPVQESRAAHALKKYGDMNAAVFLRGSRSPSNSLEFMAHHEYGEHRRPKDKYIAIPMAGLKSKAYKTGRGRVKGRWKPAELLKTFSQRGSKFDGRTTTNKGMNLGPPKGRVPGSAFIISSRRGDPLIARRRVRGRKTHGQLEFLYILKRGADIRGGWGFVDEVYSSVRSHYDGVITKHINGLPDYNK